MKAALINYNHIKTFFECMTALRKVSGDLIFCITPEVFSVRALNSSQTSLPIISFKDSYFGEFEYTSLQPSICFQMQGQCITFMKKVSCPSSIIMTFSQEETKVYFELVDRHGIYHKYDFFVTNASAYDAVHGSDSLLSASIVTEELYSMHNTFKCPYIILSYQMEDDLPVLAFESYNSGEGSKQSFFTLKHSHLCNIKTNNDCRVILSYLDFITIVKIAKTFCEQVTIYADIPGNAFILTATNNSHSIKFEASLATLSEDDYVPIPPQIAESANNTCSSSFQRSPDCISKAINNQSPPDSPMRLHSNVVNETQLSENGRLSSSNNSSASTQVVPWKVDSCQYQDSPVFPSKRKHTDIVVDKSQPSEEEENIPPQRLF